MYRNATFAMVVSRTSMKVATATSTAISHGLALPYSDWPASAGSVMTNSYDCIADRSPRAENGRPVFMFRCATHVVTESTHATEMRYRRLLISAGDTVPPSLLVGVPVELKVGTRCPPSTAQEIRSGLTAPSCK